MLAVPSWLISAIMHLILLLLLAFVTFSVRENDAKHFIVANALPEETEVFEELEFETDLDELKTVEINMIPAPQDPGMADFGMMAGVDTSTTLPNVGLTAIDDSLTEIGALFGSEGQGMARAGEGLGDAQFFGVKATGNRFVFVVDSSKSMKGGKFEAACRELVAAAGRLSEQQSFYVVFFDWDAYRMFDLKNPQRRMARATEANIRRLQYWCSTVELELKTNPLDAMEFAMSLMPDAIYVLSDGKFTDRGKTVNWLKKANVIEDEIDGRLPVVTIHTIGFYSNDDGTLEKMAKDYGGTYRFVPPPPGWKKGGGKPRPPGVKKPRKKKRK